MERSDGVCRINGHPNKLRGLNRHETFPFIGRAAANRLQRRDADIIKYDFGCNIVRCSHYPQDPEFLERCDEIGLLVLEEMAGWNFVSIKPEWQKIALDNLTEMIIRDRNHPSIISFGVRVNQSADFHEFYTATNSIAHTWPQTGLPMACVCLIAERKRNLLKMYGPRILPFRPGHRLRSHG